ncbi:MAG: hypothetical protein KIS91_09850 [Anaerolineae bacterium]|nr:hypothetical protein [Anaerolineae bacterium]
MSAPYRPWLDRLRRRLARLALSLPDWDSLRHRLPTRRSPPTAVPYPGSPDTAADFSIGAKPLGVAPRRFGVNIEAPEYELWSLGSGLFNTMIADAGCEPIVLRYKGIAAGGDATSIHTRSGADEHAHRTVTDGFFDGADVRIYRVEAGRLCLVRCDRVVRYLASEMSGYRIELAADGPPVKVGDLYFLALERADVPIDSLGPAAAHLRDADMWRVYPNWGDNSAVTKRRDSDAAPAGRSRTSLRVTVDAPMEGGVVQFVAGAPRQGVLNALTPGRAYRLDLWLRQEGIGDGRVRVALAPYARPVEGIFQVSGDWAAYSLIFNAPQTISRETIGSLTITFQGPGTLWVDNVQLYDRSQSAYALRPEALAALKAFRPGCLRVWSGHTNTGWGTSLENWLARDGEGLRLFHPDRGPISRSAPCLPTALALAREVGATPWLIVHPSFDEAEWLGLMEYLAGPPDSPYGARRAADGQVRPWTDEFERIHLEFSNEPWCNIFPPWAFESGKLAGQVAEYFFQVVRSSPYYAAVADRLDLIFGGQLMSFGPFSFGATARRQSPATEVIAMSSYLGGWDAGDMPEEADSPYQALLLFAPWVIHYHIDQQVATQNLLAKTGLPYRLAITEAGPGYRIPTVGRAYDPAHEARGKSLAAAIATLDAMLYQSLRGFRLQAFFALQPGSNWASHTPLQRGFRPHAAWLALQLRNRYATGDMVGVTTHSAPTADLPALNTRWYRTPPRPGVPLVTTYAFKDGPRYSIFVLSRRLNRATPVTLRLPARPRAASLYTLAGDPRATNRDAARIAIKHRRVHGLRQVFSFDLPPSAAYLFVVDTDH